MVLVDASSIWWSVHPCPWTRLSSLIDATASMLRCPLPFFFCVRLCLFSRAEYIIRVVSGFLCLYTLYYIPCPVLTFWRLSILPSESFLFYFAPYNTCIKLRILSTLTHYLIPHVSSFLIDWWACSKGDYEPPITEASKHN